MITIHQLREKHTRYALDYLSRGNHEVSEARLDLPGGISYINTQTDYRPVCWVGYDPLDDMLVFTFPGISTLSLKPTDYRRIDLHLRHHGLLHIYGDAE